MRKGKKLELKPWVTGRIKTSMKHNERNHIKKLKKKRILNTKSRYMKLRSIKDYSYYLERHDPNTSFYHQPHLMN